MSKFEKIVVPKGEKITKNLDGSLNIPDNPILLFIEGDGIGADLTKASQFIWNKAIEKAYKGKRKISWMEIYAGEKANEVYGEVLWLPKETLRAIEEYLIAIKGPLTTPIGGGIRSLNVVLRQELDLYACVRPVRYFKGVPSPVYRPELTDMIIFRENTEDIYSGIEFKQGTPENKQIIKFLDESLGKRPRFPESSGIGIKPISREGTERLIYAAVKYALENKRRSVTLVHKGNIMKYTEGFFKECGYDLIRKKFSDYAVIAEESNWQAPKEKILVKNVITDSFLQQILTRPEEYDVVATMNLNGDYISDALAACVGGIGISPGANINYNTGHAIFEATHGTAPKYKNLDKVNPSSLVLSGEMMFRHLGWTKAAEIIIQALEKTFQQKKVTYDFARLMEDATELKCSEFAQCVVDNMVAL